jgi:hypothetical protein
MKRLLIEQTPLAQPVEQVVGPWVEAFRVGRTFSETNAMPTMLIKVEIAGNFFRTQGLGELQAVFHRHGRVIPSVPNEAGRRIGADLLLLESKPIVEA